MKLEVWPETLFFRNSAQRFLDFSTQSAANRDSGQFISRREKKKNNSAHSGSLREITAATNYRQHFCRCFFVSAYAFSEPLPGKSGPVGAVNLTQWLLFSFLCETFAVLRLGVNQIIDKKLSIQARLAPSVKNVLIIFKYENVEM